jgi:hypothetical protein
VRPVRLSRCAFEARPLPLAFTSGFDLPPKETEMSITVGRPFSYRRRASAYANSTLNINIERP